MRRVIIGAAVLCAAGPALAWIGGIGMMPSRAYDAAVYEPSYYSPGMYDAAPLWGWAPVRYTTRRSHYAKHYQRECGWNYYKQTLSQCMQRRAALHTATPGISLRHRPQPMVAVIK